MTREIKKTALFIMPRSSNEWKGAEGVWILTAGWAAAAKELWGDAVVATTDGIFSAAEVLHFPKNNYTSLNKNPVKRRFRNLVPEFIITAAKDIKLKFSKPSFWPVENYLSSNEKEVALVWERHDLFPGPGKKIANRLQVPYVIFVDAPIVWEAKKWGVKRPVWGKWLEKNVEAVSLKQADLVLCISAEVQKKVISMGVPAQKTIVLANRVDSTMFHPSVEEGNLKQRYQLEGKRIIGWTGSFRRFHGLDTVIKAFKLVNTEFSDTVLMLVGDGMEKEHIRTLSVNTGIAEAVIFTGKQPVTQIPEFLANFHLAIVSALDADTFHYSPLKLREYLATARAVIAPKAGDLPSQFEHGRDLLFYEPGNVEDLAQQMRLLLTNSTLKKQMEDKAVAYFEKEGTWLHELKKVCNHLAIPNNL